MRNALRLFPVLVASACSSTSSGGAVNLSFGDAGANASVVTVGPAGAAMVQGTFSASGDFEGQYTLSTNVPSGSPIASCLLSVDGEAPSTSVQVDATTTTAHTLIVEINLANAYQGQGVCNVTATNNSKPNVGETVIISVSAPAGDAG